MSVKGATSYKLKPSPFCQLLGSPSGLHQSFQPKFSHLTHHTFIVQSWCLVEPSPIFHPELLGSLGCIIPWAHMSLSCHGPSLLPTGGSWNFVSQMAQVDHQFLLNRLHILHLDLKINDDPPALAIQELLKATKSTTQQGVVQNCSNLYANYFFSKSPQRTKGEHMPNASQTVSTQTHSPQYKVGCMHS